MKKFLRFRHRDPSLGPPEFISWFEPVHDLLEHAALSFATRMGSATWMIATPHGAAFWDGALLRVDRTSEPEPKPTELASPGEAVSGDAIEALWLAYYESTFAPALANAAEMASHMPVRYWKSPPDAKADPALIGRADPGARRDRRPRNVPPEMEVAIDMEPLDGPSLKTKPASLDACKRCALWRNATQPVGGSGRRTRGSCWSASSRAIRRTCGQAVRRAGGQAARRGARRGADPARDALPDQRGEALQVGAAGQGAGAAAARAARARGVPLLARRGTGARRAEGRRRARGDGAQVADGTSDGALRVSRQDDRARARLIVPTYHPSYALRVMDPEVRDEVFGTIVEALVFASQIADGTASVRTPFKA